MNRWLASLVVIALVLGSIGRVSAANPGPSLTTSPVTLVLNVKPGQTDTRTLSLLNNSAQPLPIKMGLEEFKAAGSSGLAQLFAPASNDPAASYVSFSPASFTAQPGVWSYVKMTIKLPPSANLGYYFAAVFSPQLPTSGGQRTTSFKGSNGILILIDTGSSNERKLVNLASFKATKGLYEYLPATFNVTLHNSGNIFLAPFGNIYISRSASNISALAALKVNPNSGNVLPHSSRTFSASWSDGFPVFKPKIVDGQVVTGAGGLPVEQLTWDFSKASSFRFGKYYANLTVIYMNGTRAVPITGQLSFWVIPWKLLLVLLVIVVILGFGLFTISRGAIRRLKGLKR